MRAELTLRAKAAASDAAVIEVDSVQKRFGEFYAVKGISFSVASGEVFGLLGANGAGKSTTFRMLCGLLPVTAGELTVAGRDLRRAVLEVFPHGNEVRIDAEILGDKLAFAVADVDDARREIESDRESEARRYKRRK